MDSLLVQCVDLTILAQRAALFVLGILVFINLVCTANYMPEDTPFIFWSPVALAAGGSIMMVHGAWFNQLQNALWAGAVTAGMLTLLMLTLWWEGYHVSKHLRQIAVMKQIIKDTETAAKDQALADAAKRGK